MSDLGFVKSNWVEITLGVSLIKPIWGFPSRSSVSWGFWHKILQLGFNRVKTLKIGVSVKEAAEPEDQIENLGTLDLA